MAGEREGVGRCVRAAGEALLFSWLAMAGELSEARVIELIRNGLGNREHTHAEFSRQLSEENCATHSISPPSPDGRLSATPLAADQAGDAGAGKQAHPPKPAPPPVTCCSEVPRATVTRAHVACCRILALSFQHRTPHGRPEPAAGWLPNKSRGGCHSSLPPGAGSRMPARAV